MTLFSAQEVGLGGNRILPLLRVLLVLFVGFFRLLFEFLKLLFLSIDCLGFLLYFSDFHAIYPDVFAFFVRNVFSKFNLVVADPLPELVSFHFVTFDDILEHLLLASRQQILFDFEFLFQKAVFLVKRVKLSPLKMLGFLVRMGVLRVHDLFALSIDLLLVILKNGLFFFYHLFATFRQNLCLRHLLERPGLHRFESKVIRDLFVPLYLILG